MQLLERQQRQVVPDGLGARGSGLARRQERDGVAGGSDPLYQLLKKNWDLPDVGSEKPDTDMNK